MLKSLAKIMDQFDINEIKDNPGLFGKLFGNFRKQLDKILAKYHTMGEEVDKIYVQLKGYESEIKQSNKKLDTMFKTNVDYYHELVKYILAGEQACKEIEAYIAQRQQDMENTGDQSIQFELTSLNQALMMLEQRTQDLIRLFLPLLHLLHYHCQKKQLLSPSLPEKKSPLSLFPLFLYSLLFYHCCHILPVNLLT